MQTILKLFAKKPSSSVKSLTGELKIIELKTNQEIQNKLRFIDTQSNLYDYQQSVYSIYKKGKIIKDRPIINNNDKRNKKIEDSSISKNNELSLSSSNVSNFFNDYSKIIVSKCSNDTILDVSTSAFVGSIDSPKDIPLSLQLLSYKISENSGNSLKELEFYHNYFLTQSLNNLNKEGSQKSNKVNNPLNNGSYFKEKYLYAREFLKVFLNKDEENMKLLAKVSLTKDKLKLIMIDLYNIFTEVSDVIYESHYFIGKMHKEGYLSTDNQSNVIKAYKHFSYAASNFHAIAFYELYQMTKNGELDTILYKDYDTESKTKIKNNVSLQYLSFSAEEGYTEAMFELGNSYINNNINIERDYFKALAWHRQACRNGYFLSYEICGDLLNIGGHKLKSDKILALAMYNTAYNIIGDKDILKKIEILTLELKQANQYIPELYAKNNI